MIAGQKIAVASRDRGGNAGRQEQRHAMGDVAMMMMTAAMTGMLVGMMIAVVQRDIAEQHMLMIAGLARHVLHFVDHAGGAGAREYKRQRYAKQCAQFPER